MRLTNAYHSVFGIVRIKVDATDEHGGICRGCRDDNLLGTTLQVSRCPDEKGHLSIFRVSDATRHLLIYGGENT